MLPGIIMSGGKPEDEDDDGIEVKQWLLLVECGKHAGARRGLESSAVFGTVVPDELISFINSYRDPTIIILNFFTYLLTFLQQVL